MTTITTTGRGVAVLGLLLLGVGSLLGSSAGPAPECSIFSDSCNPYGPPPPPLVSVSVSPSHATVQAGQSVTFTAVPFNAPQPRYTWCRQPPPGLDPRCLPIDGATGPSLTLPAVGLDDDGALYTVELQDPQGSARASARLGVSSLPGVTLADTEFALADWSVPVTTEPALGGPQLTLEQATSGGAPGAWQRLLVRFDLGPAQLLSRHVWQRTTYDPATQGAVLALDFTEDCRVVTSALDLVVRTAPLIEQAGRRYAALDSAKICSDTAWQTRAWRSMLSAADFQRLDGPACDPGEPCPDLSASGAPLRFGVLRQVGRSATTNTTATVEQGLDNWSVTVWRR